MLGAVPSPYLLFGMPSQQILNANRSPAEVGFQVNNKPLLNVASIIINFEVVFALDALPHRSPSHSLTEASWFAAAYMYICKPVLPIIYRCSA